MLRSSPRPHLCTSNVQLLTFLVLHVWCAQGAVSADVIESKLPRIDSTDNREVPFCESRGMPCPLEGGCFVSNRTIKAVRWIGSMAGGPTREGPGRSGAALCTFVLHATLCATVYNRKLCTLAESLCSACAASQPRTAWLTEADVDFFTGGGPGEKLGRP